MRTHIHRTNQYVEEKKRGFRNINATSNNNNTSNNN